MHPSLSVDVAVLHANPVIGAGLVSILSRHQDFNVHDPIDAAREDQARPSCRARIVITDYQTGIAMLRSTQADDRGETRSQVIFFTGFGTGNHVRIAIEQGVKGYVLLDCDSAEIIKAVRRVASGDRYLCAQATQRVAETLAQSQLTRRELEVLKLVARGDSNKVIARALSIELGTVKAHVKATLEKLDATSRTHAVATARERGLLDDSQEVLSLS